MALVVPLPRLPADAPPPWLADLNASWQLDTVPGIKSRVDDSAEDDDRFLGPRIDILDEGLQGGVTSVDVAIAKKRLGISV
jgi:hypothetical protein